MDFNQLIARAKAIITTPKTEWPVIAQEPTTPADLYKGYIIILAAIPAIAGFVKGSFIGTDLGVLGQMRVGVGAGLVSLVISYALALVSVFIMALIVDALAPSFGGQKDRTQALKAVAYSMTAGWVAGAAIILPWIGVLVMIVGALYGIYLLYLGLPHTMKAPQEKAVGYTVVIIIVAFVLQLIIGSIVGLATGFGMGAASYSGNDVRFDKDSPGGKLEQWGKDMEEASKKLEAAQQSGDQQAQTDALAQMMGAALSGGGGAVEALPADRLKPFLPEKLNGWQRTDFAVERNSAMGIQVSQARATYANDDGDRNIDVEIVDTGSAKGLLALAGFAGGESESESDGTIERTYRDDGRLVREYWDRNSGSGEYSLVVGERFTVKVEGSGDDIDDLKEAAEDLDLSGLEALKNEGAK